MSQIHKQAIYKAMCEPFFAKDIFSRIPVTEFEDEYRTVATTLNRYYKTNDVALDENTFLTLIEEHMVARAKSLEEQQRMFNVVSDMYKIGDADQNEEAISESIKNFVRKILAREAIMEAVAGKDSLADDETLNTLLDNIRDVLTIEVDGGANHILDFFADRELKKAHLKNLQAHIYPTDFFAIDAICDGGLARGEVGMINAGTGQGKTSWAVNQTRNYVRGGLNVLYLPLEEKTDRMLVRFEQLFSQKGKGTLIPDGELDEALYDNIQEAYQVKRNPNQEKPWGNLWIRKYRPQELTPAGLAQVVSDIIMRKGERVDVVIIDYPDLMKNPFERGGNESDAGGKLYEAIRACAQEYDFVCWTLSQLNRSSYGQQIKDSGSIEGSKRKMNAVEFIGTINQSPEEFQYGFLRMYADKVRNNGGKAYDKMLYFKVIPETMTIRDETQEERQAHLQLLEDTLENAIKDRKQDKTYTPKDAQVNIDALNQKIGG